MKKYDVIVAGGSCAGAAAGFSLTKAGKSVLIIDKAVFPRKKLCGGMVPEKTMTLLKDVYGEAVSENIPIDSTCSAFGIFHATLGKVCKYSHPSNKLYFVDRGTFDHFFLNQAQAAGCEVLCGHKVTEVKENSVTMDSGEEIFSSIIIGADGANSMVRKSLSSEIKKEDYTIGLEVDIDYNQLNCFDDEGGVYPKIYFGFMNFGYGWVFPKKAFATVGLGGMVHKNNVNVRQLFSTFLKSLLKNGNPVPDRFSGFPVPCHNLIKKPGLGNILLCGDAAGFVEPITGEGIYFAILSGQLAARAILGSDDPADRYNRLIRKRVFPLFRQALFMRPLFFNPRIFSYAMHKMMNNGKYCKYYLDLLSGELDYRGYIKTALRDRNEYRSE
jgi:geranylgeranyl reductase family protein